MQLQWTKTLSSRPLCAPPEPPCIDHYMVNATAISNNGARVIAGTYYKNYQGTVRERVDGRFGTYVFNRAGALLLSDEFNGSEGVYAVAMSGDGRVAASGGLLTRTTGRGGRRRGLVRAWNVATGNRLLNTSVFADRVNALALSHTGKVLAVVTETSLYVFLRTRGRFNPQPHFVNLVGRCDTVAVHPSGTWVAAADYNGWVYYIPVARGRLGAVKAFRATQPNAAGTPVRVKLRSVAISRHAEAVVAGGGMSVYYFSKQSLTAAQPAPLATFSAFGNAAFDGVKWVAVADDGTFAAAVVNDRAAAGADSTTGRLFKLSFNRAAATLTKDWERSLQHPPNSTSINAAGTRITAADGWPNHTPGAFYLFDNQGTQLDVHGTADMNWPMQISADGSGIAAGSDDNQLFYFTP